VQDASNMSVKHTHWLVDIFSPTRAGNVK
jgi:hypothetical protein